MKTKKAIVFSSKPVETTTERMTIFNCRGCDACITGSAAPIGPLSVGWALLRRVDGRYWMVRAEALEFVGE